MESTADQKHPCGHDVQVVQLHARHHGHHQEAGQFSQRECTGQPNIEMKTGFYWKVYMLGGDIDKPLT